MLFKIEIALFSSARVRCLQSALLNCAKP